ncbi:ABC transporter permease [Cohnella candidum]|uniref:FtsX-like permease family protein n=1 Tax=Cohnella candidum TaxID=2674991 RepID=A0A3G3K2R0_9BACL|nr:ABC transporter permease [Cohnella candidum]AYQ74660.1 FtsX-like permease family protein [Cohnella candidum]
MKGYTLLSGRYLKQQRRRSALTVLGIVLSVALISALLTMGQALKDNQLQQQIAENGSFHFAYSQPSPGLYDKLKNHALVGQVGRIRSGAETQIDGTYKLYVEEANDDAFRLLPIHLASGRLPETADEAVLEEWIVDRLPGKPKLRDSVTLNAPDGKPHGYRLVGILVNQKYTQVQQASPAYTLLREPAGDPGAGLSDQLFVTFKKGVDISDHLAEFEKLGTPFATNRNVLTLMGESADSGLNKALIIIFGTLVGLVVLSTIAVIYNAFHISVIERIRQFGLLRTIGATPRQIRNLVLNEASTLALIGIPVGLAVGWGGLWLALWLMIQGGFNILQMEDFRLTFHWWIMGVSVGVSLAAVYVAAWLPARKAAKVSPVDAVKGAGSIVRESYRRARLPSPLRLLGIEGKMASQNIRRNRTKFRITTFSIVVSVMLFIVFHYFTQEAFKLTVDTTENNKIAFELNRYSIPTQESDGTAGTVPDIVTPETMRKIADLPGVEGIYGRYDLPSVNALVPDEKLNPAFAEAAGIQWEKGKTPEAEGSGVPVNLQLYDDAKLEKAKRFLSSGTVDADRMSAEDAVILIQTVRPYSPNEKKKEILPLARYKIGDTIALQFGDDLSDAKSVRRVKVAGILSQSPFDSAYQPSALTVIGTKATIAKLIEAAPPANRPFGTAVMGLSVALKDGADSEPVRIALERIAADLPGVQLINIVDQQKQERQFALQMQIFVYGFLLVIGLIGSLNIINTVQTNLLLRRREIGLLQAVGMTMGQIRKMATAEGVWFGVIGSLWGLLLGGALSYFLFSQLSNIQGMPFQFPWTGAVIACVFALGVGLLSVQGPLRRMAKANLIEELRDEA